MQPSLAIAIHGPGQSLPIASNFSCNPSPNLDPNPNPNRNRQALNG
jgi:hypothetical protein